MESTTEEKKKRAVTINIPLDINLRLELAVLKRSAEEGRRVLKRDFVAQVLDAALPPLDL